VTSLLSGPTDARDAARVLGSYSRRFAAGAFATPTAKELADAGWLWREGLLAATKTLTRDSKRADYTGRVYVVPKGARVITHLAVDDGLPLPDLSDFDYINAYADDQHVRAAMLAEGREPVATRVAASSEIINVWGPPGRPGYLYSREEAATLTELPLHVSGGERAAVAAEVTALSGWADDYPFYSDGSWGALNLRGFWPDDPTRGVKPTEMSKTWKAEHPADLARTCGWTTLARMTPQTVALVRRVADPLGVPDDGLERVRILRMAGRDGKGGRLGRHTDITDKASGVRDGLILRLHIPLVSHPEIRLHAWSLRGKRFDVHLEPWHLYYLDARKPHAVTNPTGVDRLHLVIDLASNPTVRRAIAAGRELAP
jgi:hypothetical protein